MRKIISIIFVNVLLASHAYAAGGAGHGSTHDAGADTAHHSSGGLPQLDPSSFPSQIFWLVVIFAGLYIFYSKKSIPEISRVVENRKERIQNDLDSAGKIREEVESVQAAYEEKLREAREKSSNIYKDTESAIKKNAEEAQKAFQEKSSSEISATEKRLENALNAAMEDMNSLAAEVAIEAAEKIIGVRATKKDVKDVVKNLNKNISKKAA
ncbi:MAG: hypothetical protein OEY94_09865 [Alphaproteobacteria bacterium]|nr:hypothetical protein [Alphaproteobacteria bacterium]